MLLDYYNNILLFLGLSLILIVTPGPDLIYVLTQGISSGKRAGLISAIGVTMGIFVHTVFAAIGLSIVLKTSAIAFTAVKLAGTSYLIFLGIKCIRNKEDLELRSETDYTIRKIFTQGLISNTLNPKVALFFMAFLPQFVDSHVAKGSPTPFIFLGTVFAFMTLLFLATLGYFSGSLGQYLRMKKGLTKWINLISGSILIFLGIRLAFIKK